MATRPFDFIGADGQQLSGRLDLPEGPVLAYALFAHCFTCTKNSIAAVRISRALTARAFGVLRFDFTGLGQSDGDFSASNFSGSIADLVAASTAMEAAGMAPQLLIGHSLGGAAALAAAARLPHIRAVATVAAPFDVGHVKRLFGDSLEQLEREGSAEVHLGGRPFTIRKSFVEDLAAQDQETRIGALKRPILILHSPQDQTVDVANASSIFRAARHPKSFVSLEGADHLLTQPRDAAYVADVIAAWSSRYLAENLPLRTEAQPGYVLVEETGEGDFQVEVHAGGAHFLADEPVEVGGLGSGPTPYDLLSAGLGACTAMTLRLYARRKDLPLGRVGVTVGHRRDAAEPHDHFVRDIRLQGELSDEQRSRLMDIAERCPVHRTLERGARIETLRPPSQRMPPVEGPVQHALDSEAAVGETKHAIGEMQ